MGPNLLDLPNECLLVTLSMLRPSQVKRVAFTFNRRLLALALPLLQPLRQIHDDESYFESVFDKMRRPPAVEELVASGFFEDFCFHDRPYSWTSRSSRYLEYLDLMDDLGWLEECAKADGRYFKGWERTRLHLYLLCDHVEENYANMYLDQAGRHAIFVSFHPCDGSGWGIRRKDPSPFLNSEDLDVAIGMPLRDLNSRMELEDVNFERWLVHGYFEETSHSIRRPCLTQKELVIVPEHVKKYWYHVYTEEGRTVQ